MAGVTIKDVAAVSGVSIATVSHVINKTRYVSPEITNKVNAAIKELNYYPNLLVRGLRNKRTHTIGMILPSISNEMYGALVEHIQNILFQTGYTLILCNTAYDASLELQALNTLIMKKADAIIIIPINESSEKLLEIQSMGIPLIIVDRKVEGISVDSVHADNYYGEYLAIEYLIKLGHRNIGYIDRKIDLHHSRAQRDGYLQALADYGILHQEKYLVQANGYYYKSGLEAAQGLMQRYPEITAISCYYDVIAIGAMRALLDMNYRVPEDVSVIGFDGVPLTESTSPRLTTIYTSVIKMAQETCRIILERLDQEQTGDDCRTDQARFETIAVSQELIIRESTGPARPGKSELP